MPTCTRKTNWWNRPSRCEAHVYRAVSATDDQTILGWLVTQQQRGQGDGFRLVAFVDARAATVDLAWLAADAPGAAAAMEDRFIGRDLRNAWSDVEVFNLKAGRVVGARLYRVDRRGRPLRLRGWNRAMLLASNFNGRSERGFYRCTPGAPWPDIVHREAFAKKESDSVQSHPTLQPASQESAEASKQAA